MGFGSCFVWGGGLNIGSLRAKKLALLGKSWWRFRLEGGSLWVRVIKSIHGNSGGWVMLGHWEGVSGGGVWSDIVRIGEEINGIKIDFSSSCIRVLGYGKDIRFWVDRWGIRGRVSKELDDLLGVVKTVVVYSNWRDKWRWLFGEDGEFTVRELAKLAEEKIIQVENGGHETLWNRLVSKKVNIFVWRALKGRLSV
ncbi:hypothetical protein Tco_0672841 [Tanacetum coccineum]